MKAKLTFDVDDENNEMDFDLDDECERARLKKALAAEDIVHALWEYDMWLRSQIKYCDREELESAREELHDQLQGHGIILDDLIV